MSPGKDGHKILCRGSAGGGAAGRRCVRHSDDRRRAKGGEDPYGKLDQQLADLVYKVEGAVYKKTGLRFRGQIVAGTVAGLGVAQMVLYGISFEMLPGPVLIWLGWDIYHRVNKEPPLPGEPVPDTAAAAEAAGPAPGEGLPAAA